MNTQSHVDRAIEPVYAFNPQGGVVLLHTGSLAAKITGADEEWIYEGQGRVLFQMAPEPHLPWEVLASVEGKCRGLETGIPATLVIPEFSELSFADPFKVNPVSDTLRSDHAETRFTGGLPRTRIGNSESLSELRFHLLDLPLDRGTQHVLHPNGHTFPGRISLEVDQWLVDLDVWPDWLRMRGLSRGVFPLLYVRMCRIRHKDGLVFSACAKPLESLMTSLVLFLSFVAARSVGAALPVGFDESGKKQYVEWSSTLVGTTRDLRSWFPRGNPGCLPPLFTQFAELAREPHWHRTLITMIRSYTAVGASWADFGYAVGVAFIAFASLSHKVLVLETAELSRRRFEATRTSDKLRMLLRWAGIPIAVPDGLKALRAAADCKRMDAPNVLAWIRNRMIHPDHRDGPHRDVVQEAWILSLWYLELLVLRLLCYNGPYHCRVDPSESPREDPLVPWALRVD